MGRRAVRTAAVAGLGPCCAAAHPAAPPAHNRHPPPFPRFPHTQTRPQVVSGLPFFATRVRLSPSGVSEVAGVGQLDDLEEAALAAAAPQLLGDIEKVRGSCRGGAGAVRSRARAGRAQ